MFFAEHGEFEVKVEDNILFVDATGPFNEELVKQYEKCLELCIQKLEKAKWNQIISLHKYSLFTPEAEHKLTQTLKNRKERGLVASVVVLHNTEGESLIKAQMSRCYESADIRFEFASSIDDAKKSLLAY